MGIRANALEYAKNITTAEKFAEAAEALGESLDFARQEHDDAVEMCLGVSSDEAPPEELVSAKLQAV